MNDYEPLNISTNLTLNMTREDLGREVRRVWVECAMENPDSPPRHLLDWDELDERNKEIDRRIGEGVAKVVMTNLSDDEESAVHADNARLKDALQAVVSVIDDMRAENRLHGHITDANSRWLIHIKPHIDAALLPASGGESDGR